MFHFLLLLFTFNNVRFILMEKDYGSDLESLIPKLRNDENLDLSVDEEYEDLRSELLAYHSALNFLTDSRRSLLSTPCANLGGICINRKLCPGFRQLTEVPGCKSGYNVCCFVWNIYNVRDHKEHGIPNYAFPWKSTETFGGEGIKEIETTTEKRRNKKKGSKRL